MTPKNTTQNRYRYAPFAGYETRSERRLEDDRGIDQAAAEAILHLRSQVIELQSHIRQLEADLASHTASQQLRLARYREIYYEATWIDVEFPE